MEENLVKEIENLLTLTDVELQRKLATKILHYLLTLNITDNHHLLITKFLQMAIEILPSSSLPYQLSKKLGIPVQRKRRISFSTPTLHTLDKQNVLSPEAQYQAKREKETLCLFNTDSSRRYNPKIVIKPGLPMEPKKVSLSSTMLVNCYRPKVTTDFNKKYSTPKIEIDKFIEDPGILNEYLKNFGPQVDWE